MNKIINIILSGLLWRRYKFLLVSLITLVIFMIIVGQVHQDYLRYNEIQNEPNYVGISFAVKWLVWFVSVAVFLTANHFYNKYKQAQKDAEQQSNNSALSKLIKRMKPSSANASANLNGKSDLSCEHDGNVKTDPSDPFSALRTKQKLRSYADVIIEKKKG